MEFANEKADLSVLMAEAMGRNQELGIFQQEISKARERMRELMRFRGDKWMQVEDDTKRVALGWDGTEPAVAYDFTSPSFRP